jgi:ribonuclease HII
VRLLSGARADVALARRADSKTLAEEKREALFKRIQADEKLLWAVDVISAAELSAKMLSRCVFVDRAHCTLFHCSVPQVTASHTPCDGAHLPTATR